jgi:expansin (peptidoglycan-binding protein)
VTRLSARWLATGGAVVLAGVVGVALLLQNGGSACAAPPSTSTSTGKATFYDLAGGTGNCSFPSAPADDLFVALGPSQYAGAAACGSYLDVTGPKGKVRVKVIDSCPECPVGHLDLSRTAFKKIADEVQGVVPIKYKTVVNPSTPGPLSMRIQEGASQYWFSLLVDNHANRLTSVQVSSRGGSFRSAKRAAYNYWIIEGGAGSGPFKIKVTDVYGHTATVSGIKLTPGATQKTSVRLTSGGTVGTPKKKPAAKKKASPSASPSPTLSAAAPSSDPTTVDEPPTEPAVELAAGVPAAKSCG